MFSPLNWFSSGASFRQGTGQLSATGFVPGCQPLQDCAFHLFGDLHRRLAGIDQPRVVQAGRQAAVGLALFARAPVGGSFVVDVLPGMLLLGLGAGVAFNPVLLAAMSDVDPSESGIASGVVNTSFMMGGALGLAVLASLAAARTSSLAAGGADAVAALNAGYQMAFVVGAIFAATAAVLGAVLLRPANAAAAAGNPAAATH